MSSFCKGADEAIKFIKKLIKSRGIYESCIDNRSQSSNHYFSYEYYFGDRR